MYFFTPWIKQNYQFTSFLHEFKKIIKSFISSLNFTKLTNHLLPPLILQDYQII